MSSYRSILVNPRAYAWGCIGVFVGAVLFTAALQGQVNTATLLGTVKDPTSAAVPNATVVVKSLETGQERTIVTDSTGNYTFANLQVGHYRLTVSAPGFKTTTISDIELQVAQMATANVSLEIGQASQNVTVSAELPLMNGSNRFNGDVYWFFRNNAMDARNFFFVPPPGVNQSNEVLRRNQAGGTFGGPIRRDKTFFFVDFESTQLSRGQNFNNVVGSPAQRGGDFSTGRAITDPLTGKPFPQNLIPADRISKQALFFLPYMPTANFVSGATYRAILTNALTQSLNKGDVKVDHQLTGKDHLMGRYSIADNQESDPNPY